MLVYASELHMVVTTLIAFTSYSQLVTAHILHFIYSLCINVLECHFVTQTVIIFVNRAKQTNKSESESESESGSNAKRVTVK